MAAPRSDPVAPVKSRVPPPAAGMRAAASRATRNAPNVATRHRCSNSHVSVSVSETRTFAPGLKTTTLGGPSGRAAKSKSARTASSVRTSVGQIDAVPPAASISSARSRSLSPVRPASTTCMPSAANLRATAAPSPR